MSQYGICGKLMMTKSIARDALARHERSTHDKTMHVYYCTQCDAFHLGHDLHRPLFMHRRWRERKHLRQRGGRRLFSRMSVALAAALLASASAASAAFTLTGSYAGPNDVDEYRFSQAAGEVVIDQRSANAATELYLGLYRGDALLAVTGPGEGLDAYGAGGQYRLAVTGSGPASGYVLTDAAPSAVLVPEPGKFGVLAFIVSAFGRRPTRKE